MTADDMRERAKRARYMLFEGAAKAAGMAEPIRAPIERRRASAKPSEPERPGWTPRGPAIARQMALEICRTRGVKTADIFSRSRVPYASAARQELMYRLSRERRWSLGRIGEYMNRDHSTVLHGIRAHERRIAAGWTAPSVEAAESLIAAWRDGRMTIALVAARLVAIGHPRRRVAGWLGLGKTKLRLVLKRVGAPANPEPRGEASGAQAGTRHGLTPA